MVPEINGRHPARQEADMDIRIGDILRLKKPHPCGSYEWRVTRIGMDFKMVCRGCGHEIMQPRAKVEKSIKSAVRDGAPISLR